MRPGFIAAVAGREITATLRDSRAVLANLLIPLVVLPLVLLGLPLLIGGLFGREAVSDSVVGVEGLARLPDPFVQALRDGNIRPLAVDDAEAAVRSEQVTSALRVPQDFASRLEAGDAELVFFRKSGGLRAELVDRHQQLVARAGELKASRERLIDTQDAERRRLERDIHDGAQQHLVALAVNLRLAQTIAARSPERVARVLADQADAARVAIEVSVARVLGSPAFLAPDGPQPAGANASSPG